MQDFLAYDVTNAPRTPSNLYKVAWSEAVPSSARRIGKFNIFTSVASSKQTEDITTKWVRKTRRVHVIRHGIIGCLP